MTGVKMFQTSSGTTEKDLTGGNEKILNQQLDVYSPSICSMSSFTLSSEIRNG